MAATPKKVIKTTHRYRLFNISDDDIKKLFKKSCLLWKIEVRLFIAIIQAINCFPIAVANIFIYLFHNKTF